MRPNRSNYEIWFANWLDGNLNEAQVEELKVFLKQNPDLEEELNGLALINLKPPELMFSGKEDLKKSFENLTESQFEQLCIANLENDLKPGQKAELNEIIDHDEKKRKKFEVIQKLKLYPLTGSFKRKSSVKKITAGQRILRLSAIGLSVAATIAVLVVASLLLPVTRKPDTLHIVQNILPDTLLIEKRSSIFITEAKAYPDRRIIRSGIKKTNRESPTGELNMSIAEQVNIEIYDSTSVIQRHEALGMLKVTIPENIMLAYRPSVDVLRTFDPGYIPPLIDNYRSNVDRFLARIFHEKIMKDTISVNRPVEKFDIAVAGITGLNKLFGWEMALKKTSDENGVTRSYNFTSKILKFNAPVKKTDNRL